MSHVPVLQFTEALERHPRACYAPYNRVSTGSQAGPTNVRLAEKTAAVLAEARAVAPGRLRHVPFSGVERGKLNSVRPALRAAVAWALGRPYPVILVASDLSRFIRPEAYHRTRNPDAWPTDEEFGQLRELTGGLTLATLLDPRAHEGERHSAAVRRTGRVGRPTQLDRGLAYAILVTLGEKRSQDGERAEWQIPLSAAALRHGVTKSAVQRLLDGQVPSGNGLRWKDLRHPAVAYLDAFGDPDVTSY